MRVFRYSVLCAALLTASLNHLNAREYPGDSAKSGRTQLRAKAAGCSPAQTITEFYVNNIRTSAETGGNTWYDRGNGNPYYEVPAEEGNHAIFAGALWMGGLDPAGNLKLAGIRFRTNGNDFWPGPLSADGSASIEQSTCAEWDKFFLMSKQNVEKHRYYFILLHQGIDPSTDPLFENGYEIPTEILDWPAHGDAGLGQSPNLAPFADLRDPETDEVLTTPGFYEPELGDYPLYDLEDDIDCRTRLVTDPVPLFGDFTMYWIFNDKGNVHTESGGEPIGMEIQAQMFGFTTNDEINNMTFCNYVLINRGTLNLEDTYFAQWVDTDLGNAFDDFVGCDVMRGLGYAYNGDDFDDGSSSGPGYGSQPPAIGVDFFEGPYQDPDGINNAVGIGPGEALNGLGYTIPGDSTSDQIIDNERFGMRRFLYHNSGTGPQATQDPQSAIHYYNMMRGIWRNGVPMTFGGTGYVQNCPDCLVADFMFPGDTDPLHWGTQGVDPSYPAPGGWTEENEGNDPQDRRFVQSAGPFILEPGEFNNITVGVVYAKAPTGGPFASVRRLRQADDKAQALFDNCFRLLDGPDAPDLTAQELDKEIILYLRNTNALSNNLKEQYMELDPTIPPVSADSGSTEPNDQYYRFQGYQVYQVKNSEVSVSQIEDPEFARLVYQCDIRDFDENGVPVGQIINYEIDEVTGLPTPVEKVNGANEGIGHSIRVTTDLFASDDTRLINFKKYYFIAVAYGYNNYQDYNPDPNDLTGQATPYLRGRASSSGGEIREITVIPHKPVPEQFGTVFSAQYGDGVPVTRIEGKGNGGNDLVLNEETVSAIMESEPYKADVLTYEPGNGPIDVKIVDPLNVKPAKFQLYFYNTEVPGGGYSGDIEDAEWYMVDTNNPTDTVWSETTIEVSNEQIIPEYGISVTIGQYQTDVIYSYVEFGSGDTISAHAAPALYSSGISFESGVDGWLTGVSDGEGKDAFNWIRSGIINETPEALAPCYILDGGGIDPALYNDFYVGNVNGGDGAFIDPTQIFEGVAGGVLAPARLVGSYDCGTAPLTDRAKGKIEEEAFDVTAVSSVDIYITQDKSKWSRVPIYEMQPVPALAQLEVDKMFLRGALSVDKNGKNQLQAGANINECTMNGDQAMTQADVNALVNSMSSLEFQRYMQLLTAQYPQITSQADLVGLSFGMGWFPGYAINPESGERMNMAFGENSYLAGDNGRDMLWNPSSRVVSDLGTDLIFGGEHYLYVFKNLAADKQSDLYVPMYDAGQNIYDAYNNYAASAANFINGIRRTWSAFDWIMSPISSSSDVYLSPEQGLVPGEVKITAHVAKKYESYATVKDELGEGSFPFTSPTENYNLSENYWYPTYEFSTDGVATVVNDTEVAKNALDLIDIVPNPYYAYSSYEQTRLENTVKFVNLPPQCTIKIFTLNGTLVRILDKDNPDTYLDWNLQNEFFIPISGGLYLIHVESPDLGERVLKFFAATRPSDIKNF